MLRSTSLLAALALSAPALAQGAFVEDFENGSNVGEWSWGTGNETLSPVNGNPGAYLEDLNLSSCCPGLRTSSARTPFTGDWRARAVTSVGIDLVTIDSSSSVGARPLSLILESDAGTPGKLNDDIGAYFVGSKTIPEGGVPIDGPGSTGADGPSGWTSFDFAIDAQSVATPAGWVLFRYDGGPPVHTWSDIVTDVDRVEFFYGDPSSYHLFVSWKVGADNARIVERGVTLNEGSGVNSLCFSSTTEPILGSTWDLAVDASGHPGATSTAILFHAQPASGPMLSIGELLVDLSSPFVGRSLLASGGGVDVHSIPLPNDPSLAGVSVAAQAAIVGGGAELCNGLIAFVGF